MFQFLAMAVQLQIQFYKWVFRGISNLINNNKEVNISIEEARSETTDINDFRYPPSNNGF
ncbi:hypothetical protein LJC61_02255 [Ruminococcaceae bacterium OttesenSCG-928-A16]|nr:hypothetical protein [Ruminococcaceae bacterium OttesenSCG-928-A16]